MSDDIGFGRFPPEVVQVGKALAHEARWHILVELERERHARFTDLRDATGLSSGAINPHIGTLHDGGLVHKIAVRDGDGMAERYALTRFGRRCLNHIHQALFPAARFEDRWTTSTGSSPVVQLNTSSVESASASGTPASDLLRP